MECYENINLLVIFYVLAEECYVTNSTLHVEFEIIGTVKKLGVVDGESGHGSNLTLRNLKSPT
jgi:hypothetical protein